MLGTRPIGTNPIAGQLTTIEEGIVLLAARLDGTAANSAYMSLTLTFDRAPIEAISRIRPDLTLITNVTGSTAAGISAFSADLSRIRPFGSLFDGTSALAVDLTLITGYSATIPAVSGATFDQTLTVSFKSFVDSYSSVAATMAVLVEMAATSTSISDFTADWIRLREFPATIAAVSTMTVPEFIFIVGFSFNVEAFSNVFASLNFLHRVLCGQIDINPLYSGKTTMDPELCGNTEFTNQLTGKVSFERC